MSNTISASALTASAAAAVAVATNFNSSSNSISTTATAIAASTSFATAPQVLSPSIATHDFNDSLSITLYVIAGLTALTEVVALAALTTQLMRKEQRRLVQKTLRPEGSYYLPHSPVLAPLMVVIYAILGISLTFVLRALLWQGSAILVVQRLSLLLPMPMLCFAWLSACANAFAWHLTPLGNSKLQRHLRLKPITLNILTWLTPVLIFGVQLGLVIAWPIVSKEGRAIKASIQALMATLPAEDPLVQETIGRYERKLRQAESLYQAVWAVWAFAYGACWLIYATYSSMLIALLGRQMKFLNSSTVVTDPLERRSASIAGPGSRNGSTSISASDNERERDAPFAASSSHQTHHRYTSSGAHSDHSRPETPGLPRRQSQPESVTRKSIGSTVKRGSKSTIKFITSAGPEMKYISKRELLRRNTRLVIFELVAFSIFIVAWWVLSLAKAIMGYRILTNPTTGPITIIGELFESSLFGLVVVSLLLKRGINILRNRKEQINQGVVSTQSSSSGEESRLESNLPSPNEEKLVGEVGVHDPSKPDTAARTPVPATTRKSGEHHRNQGTNIAARRGKKLLAIDLGSGTYFVPTSSRTTTPTVETPGGHWSTLSPPLTAGITISSQHLLSYDSPDSPSDTSAAKSPGTLSTQPGTLQEGGISPMSEKPGEGTARRKSSVTFADELSQFAGHNSGHYQARPSYSTSHAPTLDSIAGSPLVPQISLLEALSSNHGEATRPR